MKREVINVAHEFVEFVPETLEPATVYISITYKTVAHLCLCGCGSKVITPLSPTGWTLRFNGKTISLHPSIGNWNLPCQSHYWITKNQVEWAERWSKRRIESGFARDQRIKQEYYGEAPVVSEGTRQDDLPNEHKSKSSNSWWKRGKHRS